MAMPLPHTRIVAGIAALTLAVSGVSGAQRAAPSTWALTNARIVPVSGPTIEQGSIVIRNGVIEAVGTSVRIPADARTLDLSGQTVYPGFIDAYGSLGLPTAANAPAGGRGAGGGGPAAAAAASAPSGAANSNYPPGLQPEVSTAALLSIGADEFTGPHTSGFTTALTAPATGIFRGQSALINLRGTDINAMLVSTNVAQHIGFTPLRGTYPSSLLGVFSALRQQLLDAQHYREVRAAYERNPRGMQRVEADPSLEALLPVLDKTQPVVMFASTEREIERALNLAREFNLRAIIAGGAEANTMAARLKAENVSVLLSTNFPRRTAAAAPDADPEPLRVLRQRVEAPRVPMQLAQANVRFAFQSGGASWNDVMNNVRSAVTNGLPADQALRALTIVPAEILGVSNRLGTIEVGKIANLTVATGDIFSAPARISQLFIDGQQVTMAAPSTPAGGRGANRPPLE